LRRSILGRERGLGRSAARQYEEESAILFSEVRATLERLRDGKTTGVDRIPAEVLKALDERGLEILHFLCQKI